MGTAMFATDKISDKCSVTILHINVYMISLDRMIRKRNEAKYNDLYNWMEQRVNPIE